MKISKKTLQAKKLTIATHLLLSGLVFSVGALCLAPIEKEITVESQFTELYRKAEDGVGVSLMFNVYWGTEEVYRILDILQAGNAKATFFIGGSWADDNVQCLRDIYARGHEIGNHGYFHKEHAKLSEEENRKEISSCNQFIQLALGVSPTLFAPPSGSYGEHTLVAANGLGMKSILWSKDTIDWRDKDKEVIYKRATSGVTVGDFVLLHPMKETADALERILQYYKNNSLQTVTVSENLRIEG